MAAQPIYQFYAELLDYKPKIWRRFQVLNNVTMARLGYILMSMFEMQAGHLFCFEVPFERNFREYAKANFPPEALNDMIDSFVRGPMNDRRYEIIDDDLPDFGAGEGVTLFDATLSKVKDVVSSPNEQMDFNYDYGDDWHVRLVLESVIIDKDLLGKELPRVLDGAGYGIIEDCGGVPGLGEIAKAFKKKSGERYRECCEWLGRTELDLAAFDKADANLRVKRIPRIFADIYERELGPTKQSIDFLERKYRNKANEPE